MVELACRVAASDRDPGLWLIRLDQSARFARAAGVKTPETDAALGRIDAALGRLLVCLETAGRLADSAIFVTGDVVFQPVHTRVDPNVVLVGAGLVGRDPRSSTGVRSWLALSRSNGRSAYVYARDAENALIAREVLEKEAADSRAFDVVPAAELAAAGADPQAWFGLSARPGYVIGNGLAQPGIRPAEVRASEGTLPFLDPAASGVGLVVWGRGIRSRVRLPDLELVDVAPTIASLLGLRLDEDLDGNPVIGLLRAAVPPPPPGPKRLGVGQDADVDRVLRELGGGRDLGTDR
jgi:arylsulfatase A-like enzyme